MSTTITGSQSHPQQAHRTPGRSPENCSAFQHSKDLKTPEKSSSGQSLSFIENPVSKDKKKSYILVAIEVDHWLNHFQWKNAIEAEVQACDLTTHQRDELIKKIVNRALMIPTRPPTPTVDFYEYAERTNDPESKKNLLERILNKWPEISWEKKGGAATLDRLKGLPTTERFIQYQVLVDAKILEENPDPSPLQKGSVQNLYSVNKKKDNSKRFPPHLRG